jgi:nucleotide-binding universal stress UspA family protein
VLNDIAIAMDGQGNQAGSYGLSLARLLGCHVTVVEGVVNTFAEMFAARRQYDLIEIRRDERRHALRSALDELKQEALAMGLVLHPLALNILGEGSFDDFAEAARLFDLVVVGQKEAGRSEGGRNLVEAVIFNSGRPALIVPSIHSAPANLTTALVAWDGSAPAARALADAIPLLVHASRVAIVHVGKTACGHASAVVEHLGRHRIHGEFRNIPGEGPVGDILLSHAADCGADFLVMGAYGRSRLSEALFGGASRTLLESMTIPILMSR